MQKPLVSNGCSVVGRRPGGIFAKWRAQRCVPADLLRKLIQVDNKFSDAQFALVRLGLSISFAMLREIFFCAPQ